MAAQQQDPTHTLNALPAVSLAANPTTLLLTGDPTDAEFVFAEESRADSAGRAGEWVVWITDITEPWQVCGN